MSNNKKKYIDNPLTQISGFDKLVEYFDKNKQKNWKEWLEFDRLFDKPGKQGIVGLFKNKNTDTPKFVFKISQYINYLVQHEYTVMNDLNKLSPFCPHFCKAVGTILCEIDPKTKCLKDHTNIPNPFKITTKYPIEKEILLTEYINKSCKFYNYIRSNKISDRIIYSTIKQVLMGISIAQRKKKFTHYDLHSNNIMMKKCNNDVVFLYILDDDNQFCVPTNGHYPVIIDFGFSYSKDLEDSPAWPSMGHTEVGFTSDRFDPIADPKLFLSTVSSEIKEKRRNKTSNKFRYIIKNMFNKLNIDLDSGWDKGHEKSASDYITDMLEGHATNSNIFDNYEHYCIDIIQSLIILPFEEHKYTDIDKSYIAFVKEFSKIEREIGNPFYNIYILKGVVDCAREVYIDYMYGGEDRKNAIKYFRQAVYERINCISKYCRPKNIHFERMLCSLLCFSRNMEGVLFDVMDSISKKKKDEYSKIPLQNIEQIYGAIEVNIPDKYVFNNNTTVFVMDCVNEKCERLELSYDTIDLLNNNANIYRGNILYKKYKEIVE